MQRMGGLDIKRPVQLTLFRNCIFRQAFEFLFQRCHARVNAPRTVIQHVIQTVHLLACFAHALVHRCAHRGVQNAVLAFNAINVQCCIIRGVHHLVYAHVVALVVHDVLPTGKNHALTMLLERARAQLVPVMLGVVERDRAHIQKWRHGAGHNHQARIVIHALVQMLHVRAGLAHAGGSLLGNARHEIQVETVAVGVRKRLDNRIFQLCHFVVTLAERRAHVVVVAFGGNLHRPAFQIGVKHVVEVVAARRWAEKLKANGVLHFALQAANELLGVCGAGLQEVVQHENGPPYVILHVLDVANKQLGVAPRNFAPPEMVLERVSAAAACGAVARASAARQAGGHGVLQPTLHGQVAGEIKLSQHAFHGVVVIHGNGVHVVGHPRKRVDMHATRLIFPGQVRDIAQIAHGCAGLLRTNHTLHQHAHGLFGGVAAKHVINAVVGNQILVEDAR